MNALTSCVPLIIAGVLLSTTREASAYLDPGSGSYLFQILIAGLTATVFFFSSIKKKTLQLCRLITGSPKPQQPEIRPASPRDP